MITSASLATPSSLASFSKSSYLLSEQKLNQRGMNKMHGILLDLEKKTLKKSHYSNILKWF